MSDSAHRTRPNRADVGSWPMVPLTVSRNLLLAVWQHRERERKREGVGRVGEGATFLNYPAGPIDGFSGKSSNRIICRLNI